MAKTTLKTQAKKGETPSVAAKNIVNERFKRAKSFRETDQEEIWKRSYNNWRGVLDQSLYPWRSKLFIPWSFTVVETIIPKVFARDPKWRAVSRDPAPAPQQMEQEQMSGYQISTPSQASVVQNLLSYQWSRMGMRLKMYDYIKDSLMYSKGYAKVTWNFKTRTKTTMEPVVGKDDEITFKEVRKSDVYCDDPNVEIVDPFDIYVDPDATSLKDAAYLIHRKMVPYAQVKDNVNYKNVEQIQMAKNKPTSNAYLDNDLNEETRYNNSAPTVDNYKEEVEILEYWECDRLS